jgi:hypothetical protein
MVRNPWNLRREIIISTDIGLKIGFVQIHLLLAHEMRNFHLTLLFNLFIQRFLIPNFQLLDSILLQFNPHFSFLSLLNILMFFHLFFLLLEVYQLFTVVHLLLYLFENFLLFFPDFLRFLLFLGNLQF